MTDADRRTLAEYGVAVVIDLRAAFERRQHPYQWPAVEVVSAPMVHDSQVRSIIDRFRSGSLEESELLEWWDLTGVFDAPFEHLAAIQTVFETFLTVGPNDVVLYHCRGGKDRTGMVSALLLEALGVAREEILADFLQSNTVLRDAQPMEDLARVINAALGSRLSPEAAFSFAGVREEWLHRLLSGIEARCGSVRKYLTESVGLGEAGLTALRSGYLEPIRSEDRSRAVRGNGT
jgi:protein-tyrosine phosphatase